MVVVLTFIDSQHETADSTILINVVNSEVELAAIIPTERYPLLQGYLETGLLKTIRHLRE